MQVVRVQHGGPRYGIVDESGTTVELLRGEPFGHGLTDLTGETVPLATARLLPPVTPTKVLAVGRNYAEHIQEMGFPTGEVPSVFLKPLQSLVPDGGVVVLPPRSVSEHVEHEAELAIIIGRRARNTRADEAADVIFGYTCANDVSARDLQRSDPQLTRGKGFDTFCPLGAAIETAVSPFDSYEIVCRVNGQERQRASTDQMIFSIPYLIEFLSSWTTLEPGDVVLTGSPAGTTALEPGDRVEIEVPGVALLTHGVAAAESMSAERQPA